MKFTIDRARWLRGDPNSMLLRPRDAKMCCMGQACVQLGVPEERLKGRNTVSSLGRFAPELLLDDQWDEYVELDWVDAAYAINDNLVLTEKGREAELTALFASVGHDLEFIN